MISQFTLDITKIYCYYEEQYNDLSNYKLVNNELVIDQDKVNAKRSREIVARLREIDIESIRPLRSMKRGNSVQFDDNKLEALENEAITLRAELSTL